MVDETRKVCLDGNDEKNCSPWFKLDKCIRGRKHLTRKHGVKFDVYFALRYTFRKVLHEEGEGWASEGMTLDKARADLREIREGQRTGKGPFTLQELREREFLKHEQEERERRMVADRKTLAAVWEAYFLENAHKSGMRTDKGVFKNHLAPLHAKFPQDITTQDIRDIEKSMRQAGKSEQTVVHMKELARRLVNYGERKGWYAKPPRWQLEIVVPKVDNIKTECLTPEQILRLKEGLDKDPDQQLADVIRLALVTGMRRGALLGLQWTDLNFDLGFILLRGEVAKSGKTATIPMPQSARTILSRIPRTDSPYVFPGKKGGKQGGLNTFFKRIKEYLPKGFRPLHGLRHTYASTLASSGQVDLYALQKLLTHESPEMTQRYAHLADKAMARGASVADECLATALFPAPPSSAPSADKEGLESERKTATRPAVRRVRRPVRTRRPS